MTGSYICRSSDIRHCKMINLTLAVPITYVNLNPTNDPVSVIDNTSYQFECETSICRPYATVKWYKDNRTIDDIADDIDLTHLSTSRLENEVTRSVLQVQPTKVDHGMRLFCLANNGGPDIYSSKQILDVLYEPSIPKCQFNSSIVNENIYIREGQDLSIECSADGYPPPFLIWTYPGGTFSGPTLSLRKVAKDASGNFTCSAQNTLKPTYGLEVTRATSFTFVVNVYGNNLSYVLYHLKLILDKDSMMFICLCLDSILSIRPFHLNVR
ncbi:CD166 antigen-like [Mya arenaria]|uniref:CD166 antigen-like n=1 Tax=Mya arenaria TaxID=6604 RepID=UPI0022DF7542|nr:CD166 antigen-like [Mya arenaria]